MRSQLVRLLRSLARPFMSHRCRQAVRPTPFHSHGPERLEERIALSSVLPGEVAPTGCACVNCAKGAAYVLGGGVGGSSPFAVKWPQPNGLGSLVTITYSYSNLLDGKLGGSLNTVQIRAAIQEAFSRWAAVAPLRFVEVRDAGPPVSNAEYDPTGKPMIRLGHRPIDGPYGQLGYGYYPGLTGLAGDIHFDTNENWTTNPALGVDLLEVATHEIGHALGLGHSQVAQSILAPTYGSHFRGLGSSFLFPDDIAGIRALYGAGVGRVIPLAPLLPPGQTFTLIDSTLYIQGTAGNDRLEIDAGANPSIKVNGVSFTGNLTQIRSISANLGQGGDVAIIRGASGESTYTFRPGQLIMNGPVWNLSLTNTPLIDLTAGSKDVVMMTGTQGNDVLTSAPALTVFRGPGFHQLVRGAGSITVNALGGYDVLYQYDTPGNDVWTATPRVSLMEGEGFVSRAVNFTSVTAYSQQGVDTARLFDSEGNDLFVAGPTSVTMRSQTNSYSVVGSNFRILQAFSRFGRDIAVLYDTPGNDRLIGTPTFTSLFGDDFRVEASNFFRVQAISRFGEDEAFLYDSAGDDSVSSNGDTVTFAYPQSSLQFTSFAYAALYGTTGGSNRRQSGLFPLTTDWYGSWL